MDVSVRRGGAPDLGGAFSTILIICLVATLSACAAGSGAAGSGAAGSGAAGPGAANRAQATDIRENMTMDDRHIAELALQIAMERRNDNDAGTWTNVLSGNHGAVVPRRTYRSQAGAFCRQYDEMVTVAGVAASFRRTACRDGSGRWTTVT